MTTRTVRRAFGTSPVVLCGRSGGRLRDEVPLLLKPGVGQQAWLDGWDLGRSGARRIVVRRWVLAHTGTQLRIDRWHIASYETYLKLLDGWLETQSGDATKSR